MSRALVVMAVLVGLTACGKKDGTPTGPSAPVVTSTGVSLSSAKDLILIGELQQLTATATFSDGTSRVVTGAWTSDATGVATVSPAGEIRGASAGEATVTVDFEGRRASHRLRVVPDFSGRWEGAYREVACEATIDWRGVCDDPDTNTRWFMAIDFSQDRAQVSGAVQPYSDATIPTTGQVALSGTLSQAGTLPVTDGIGVLDLDIIDWSTVSTDNRNMTGGFKVRYVHRKFQGALTLTLQLDPMAKVGAATKGTGAGRAGHAPARALRLPARMR